MNIYDGLKEYILDIYNQLVEELSTAEIPLEPVDERNCVVGEIDLDKYTAKHVVCIMPQSEEYESLSINANQVQSQIEVYIFVGKDSPKMLYQQVYMLGEILKKSIYHDSSLDGLVEECRVTGREFFQGVEGSTDRQAVMITLDLVFEESIEE